MSEENNTINVCQIRLSPIQTTTDENGNSTNFRQLELDVQTKEFKSLLKQVGGIKDFVSKIEKLIEDAILSDKI